MLQPFTAFRFVWYTNINYDGVTNQVHFYSVGVLGRTISTPQLSQSNQRRAKHSL